MVSPAPLSLRPLWEAAHTRCRTLLSSSAFLRLDPSLTRKPPPSSSQRRPAFSPFLIRSKSNIRATACQLADSLSLPPFSQASPARRLHDRWDSYPAGTILTEAGRSHAGSTSLLSRRPWTTTPIVPRNPAGNGGQISVGRFTDPPHTPDQTSPPTADSRAESLQAHRPDEGGGQRVCALRFLFEPAPRAHHDRDDLVGILRVEHENLDDLHQQHRVRIVRVASFLPGDAMR